MRNKEQVNELHDDLSAICQNIARKRTKIIEDYMKFYVAVSAENISPEMIANNFQLMIENRSDDDKMTMCYQMIPSDSAIMHKEEYKRLKRLEENVKDLIEECNTKKFIFGSTENLKKLLEGLYDE